MEIPSTDSPDPGDTPFLSPMLPSSTPFVPVPSLPPSPVCRPPGFQAWIPDTVPGSCTLPAAPSSQAPSNSPRIGRNQPTQPSSHCSPIKPRLHVRHTQLVTLSLSCPRSAPALPLLCPSTLASQNFHAWCFALALLSKRHLFSPHYPPILHSNVTSIQRRL